jgi:hypothetical protein
MGVIEYNPMANNEKERVLSLAFVTDRFLLVATELGNYCVRVNLRKMLNKMNNKAETTRATMSRLDENVSCGSNEDAISFITSSKTKSPKDGDKT